MKTDSVIQTAGEVSKIVSAEECCSENLDNGRMGVSHLHLNSLSEKKKKRRSNVMTSQSKRAERMCNFTSLCAMMLLCLWWLAY